MPRHPLKEYPLIEISIDDQQLRLLTEDQCYYFSVATAKNGAGEQQDSGKTPRGWHRIVAAIGKGQPLNSVFVGRRPTGEIYSPKLALKHPHRDWILTRILWLQGLEVGRNRMGGVDTMRRFVYIHGVPDSKVMGIPGSQGCINMHNNDLISLFELVSPGTKVWIQEESFTRIACITL